jgi:toxin ParE1/3/4
VRREVFFSWKAEKDLAETHRHIGFSNRARADRFLQEIEQRCESLVDFPLQGRARSDLGPGYRVLFFARRVVIVYRLIEDRLEILRVFYGGRDYEKIIKGRGN